MNADQEHKHQVVIVWVLASMILVFLWACTGCGTIGGMRDDLGDMIDHSRQHLITDPRE